MREQWHPDSFFPPSLTSFSNPSLLYSPLPTSPIFTPMSKTSILFRPVLLGQGRGGGAHEADASRWPSGNAPMTAATPNSQHSFAFCGCTCARLSVCLFMRGCGAFVLSWLLIPPPLWSHLLHKSTHRNVRWPNVKHCFTAICQHSCIAILIEGGLDPPTPH